MNVQELKSWIKGHNDPNYTIKELENGNIHLTTEGGVAEIRFNEIGEEAVIEFEITSAKSNEVVFYLHFELADDDHTKQLYDEMVESLLALKDKKTLQVLLSCSSGLTTFMFSEKLNETAKTLDLDYHFNAVSYAAIYQEIENYDVLLLAPQIGYMLNQYKTSLPDKLVLRIPTNTFASYNAVEAIQFLNEKLDEFKEEKKQKEEKENCCVFHHKTILAISIVNNNKQTIFDYRLYCKGEIIDSNKIIKVRYRIQDIYDIVNILLLKHKKIDAVGIATPGIVSGISFEHMHIYEGTLKNIKSNFEKKYGIDCFMINNANAAVVGFSLEHPEYANIVYHSQPVGYGIGGQGYIVDHKLITGKNGISGEVRFYIKRMQLTNDAEKLPYSHQGRLELVTKALLPTISILGPDAVAIRSYMVTDMEEVKNTIADFIPDVFLPDFYYIDDVTTYTLEGVLKLCVDYLESK